ncbi:vacuolar sorting protein 18 [Pseudoscourfieldia marina]
MGGVDGSESAHASHVSSSSHDVSSAASFDVAFGAFGPSYGGGGTGVGGVSSSMSMSSAVNLGASGASLFTMDFVSDLTHGQAYCCVCVNSVLYAGTRDGHLNRLDLSTGEASSFELAKVLHTGPNATEALVRPFASPSGRHVIVSVRVGNASTPLATSAETYYLRPGWKKVKPLLKLKGHFISAVAWPFDEPANSTGYCLVGTEEGKLLEVVVGDDRTEASAPSGVKERSCKLLFDVNTVRGGAVDEAEALASLGAADGGTSATGVAASSSTSEDADSSAVGQDPGAVTVIPPHPEPIRGLRRVRRRHFDRTSQRTWVLVSTPRRLFVFAPLDAVGAKPTHDAASGNTESLEALFTYHAADPRRRCRCLEMPCDQPYGASSHLPYPGAGLGSLVSWPTNAGAEASHGDGEGEVLFEWLTCPGVLSLTLAAGRHAASALDECLRDQSANPTTALFARKTLLKYPPPLRDDVEEPDQFEGAGGGGGTRRHTLTTTSSATSSPPPTPYTPYIALSLKHHAVFIKPTEVVVVNRVSTATALRCSSSRAGALGPGGAGAGVGERFRCGFVDELGMCYVLGRSAVYELAYDPDAVGRDIWRAHLALRQFDEARALARTDAQRACVATAEAEERLAQGNVRAAALLWAQAGIAHVPFEEAALRIVAAEEAQRAKQQEDVSVGGGGGGDSGAVSALAAYLSAVLDSLPASSRMQRCMVCTWLLECHLEHWDAANSADCRASGEPGEGTARAARSLVSFLEQRHGDLDRETAHRLLLSHGSRDACRRLSELHGDLEDVLASHAHERDGEGILRALRRPGTPVELLYRYASSAFALLPERAVDVFLVFPTHAVDVEQLLPALTAPGVSGSVDASAQRTAAAIRYLETLWRRDGVELRSVHDALVSLYAGSAHEGNLMHYLSAASEGYPRPLYDAAAALRLCVERRLRRPAVTLYAKLGLHDEAVDLALGGGAASEWRRVGGWEPDVELAKSIADSAGENAGDAGDEATVRRRLWLKIAVHVMTAGGYDDEAEVGDGGIGEGTEDGDAPTRRAAAAAARASAVLSEAGGHVRIEDLLPYFPDRAPVDSFRDPVCDALESYDERLRHLRDEMDASTEVAERLRRECERLSEATMTLPRGKRCDATGQPLLEKSRTTGPYGCSPFFAFPCGHAFLAAPLAKLVCRRDVGLRGSLVRTMGRLRDLGCRAPSDILNELRAKLDDALGSECPLCGDMASNCLARPLVQSRREKERWKLGS